MNNVIFTYNEEAALSASQGGFINETGAYIITITEAGLKQSESGARFIEFSGESDEGKKVQYLSVCTAKKDGSENRFGTAIVHAMMGCTGIKQLTERMQSVNNFIAPEFSGKKVGLVLQKILTSKANGDDSYKMEIRFPFIAATGQTLKEKSEGKNAETVSNVTASLKDKDDRKKGGQSVSGDAHQFDQNDDFSPF